jgi:excisionase family DNA binding protein
MAQSVVLTIREVAEPLKVDTKTVYNLARRKPLPGFKVGDTWRFKNADIDHWIEKQKKAAGCPAAHRLRKRRKQ